MVKTKYRNHRQPEDDIRCELATTISDFDKLVKQVQEQGSLEVYSVCVSNE